MRILDVGCGHCANHTKRGDVGIDLIKGLCDVQASAFDLPFAPASFDRVILSHVLEHLMNLGQALKEAKRVLVLGGLLEIEVPNPYTFFRIKDAILGKAIRGECGEHVATFCVEHLRNIAVLTKFQFKKVEYSNDLRLRKQIGQLSIFKRIIYNLIYKLNPSLQTAIKVTFQK